MNKKSRAYLKIVEWSDEDECFVGSAPPLIGPCCHGKDELSVYRQLSTIVDEWIATLEKEGQALPAATRRNYSGRFVLRVRPELHKALALRALAEGESLNAFCARKLAGIKRTTTD